MNPIKNKRDLETAIDELRNSAFNYLEKYSPSKQQLRTYLFKKSLKELTFPIFLTISLIISLVIFLRSPVSESIISTDIPLSFALLLLNRTYSSISSIPKPLRLFFAAAITDVPLPRKGSNTISPSFVKHCKDSNGTFSGNGAV